MHLGFVCNFVALFSSGTDLVDHRKVKQISPWCLKENTKCDTGEGGTKHVMARGGSNATACVLCKQQRGQSCSSARIDQQFLETPWTHQHRCHYCHHPADTEGHRRHQSIWLQHLQSEPGLDQFKSAVAAASNHHNSTDWLADSKSTNADGCPQ